MRITNEDTESIYCSWGLNLIPMNSGFPPSITSLTNCEATTNPLCGEIRLNVGQNTLSYDLNKNLSGVYLIKLEGRTINKLIKIIKI